MSDDPWVEKLAEHLRGVTIQPDSEIVARVAVEWLTARGFRQGGSLEDMQAEVYQVNVANGWFESERTFGDDVALLHSEVSEMFEAFREHGFEDQTVTALGSISRSGEPVRNKPEGVGSEIADVLIRLLDTCQRRGIDLRAEYQRKIAYNRTRGYHHGGRSI